ncbi:VENN motif pre-toxin domain-containing protein [Pluralibacter gergoviae]|nr:VENN motif pre-toxin domain-containing protein [Pluralibacter gergoviae]ELD4273881.1 VENN motif pre-toxin domain-containing protein [Pluralibacter gergoviae]ELD4279492.1 VENN motif pre-toxin domain-containing protein [Pluralibacter gergoviae]ELD4318963.1 VENN motif pre-toxin domain-containing protein [Pluralibacter gergoviae]ELD4344096.1 VENN motif pre-toxin domain-containing protein [Pluralibacter gergoviae]
MKQTGSSAGASVTWGAGFSGSASVSASRDRMNSNFDSVQEQSGLFAGNGGFDVNVGSHTQLNGGVLASTATPDKNRLETGTLGWRDIDNQADFTVEHQSAGVSTGGSYAGQFIGNMASNTLAGAHGSGHDSSTTHAAVEAGTIIIRDPGNQQQDVSTLSRDTEHAANGLSPIFDKEKEQRRLQEAQLIGETGTQVGDIARTEGDLAGLERAKKAHPDYSNDELRKTEEYKSAMKKYGTGSDIQQAISAATAAVQGLAGGDLKAAIAGGAAPYLAEVIHNRTKDASGEVNISANLMAHAVLGAVVASAQGNSALAGASGGALGEYIAQQIYPGVPRDKLTEEQKQTISALGTLAAGLAGGLTGGSTADAVAGAQAGKNAVENNYLGKVLVEGCAIAAPCRTKVAEQLLEIGVKAGITGVVAKEIADKISAEELDHLITLKMTGNDEITSKYLGLLEGKYGSSNTGGNQIVDSGPTNTGGNQTATGNIPSHTGNNQSSGQGATNTGNTDGKPDTGGNTTVTPIPDGPSADDLAYLSNNKNAIEDSWHQGSFGSSEDSLQKHYEKNGKEVGATSTEQYLRKAQAFADDLKGARKTNISGATEGVTRYYKNGKYIDIAGNGKIISFGKQ